MTQQSRPTCGTNVVRAARGRTRLTADGRRRLAARGRGRLAAALAWATAILSVALMAAAFAAPPAQARSILRGIFDDTWVKAESAEQQAIVADMADKLHVQVVRIDLHWAQAEPDAAGVYDSGYLSRILRAVDAARAQGMKVMIDVYRVPRWASDTSFWNSPPEGYDTGYQTFYPVAAEHLADWETTVEYLATLFRGKVRWWECWNEPNLWSYFYPQTTSGDSRFAARLDVKLLQRISRAVHRADSSAKVLGGVTAPVGMNDRLRTAPQRFARSLKALGAAKYWDGYSHHPYMPAGRRFMPGPRTRPNFPNYTVTLANLSTLLRIFPKEPFYLTEYGYPTRRSLAWGPGRVTEKAQARYLTTAFRHAAGFRQVKMLAWFLWKDIYVAPNDMANAYFGLRRVDGTRKPSWYAFAKLR